MPRPHFRQAFQIAALTVQLTTVLLMSGTPAMAQTPAVAGPGAASSAAPGAPCVLLFGQGRNFDPEQPAANRRWDEANSAFNLAVREPLAAAGLPVINLVLPVSAIDLPRNLQGLLAEVQRRGCTRVLETALFADVAQGVLIARLRVYPVLGLLGPQAAGSQPRIGAVAYTQQKEFTLDARVMDRVNPSRLGRVMGEEAMAALVGPRE
ncbi:hypothetical protein CS062_12630 [Roseateles chitinivorans]|uniref:Uncharacterized protein n=1 Tax=Roseateles chitinivorans TaxID=2917965 RepID=A0A2G9CB55_9BURK|nr:hypothetical protein [Roseateles chitinivorans]PIM52844.1 hypothetical protein CS062_12630 [Roseateles chitinivorans]